MTLVVVPTERHVERLARQGLRAETRAALRARLAASLLPEMRFAEARESRLALAMALWGRRAEGKERSQLDLFTGASGAAAADPSLAPLLRRGGASWVRYVASIDAAIRLVSARGVTAEHLERAAAVTAGVTRSRARALAVAMRALDEALARAGAIDARVLGHALAKAIAERAPAEVASSLGARLLSARWLLVWEPADLAWWRALDETLARVGGGARIVVPAFERPLEGARERDPLEVLSEDLASALDAPPEHEPIPMILGDLAGRAPPSVERLAVLGAQDPVAQARAVARVVSDALAEGAAVERIAVCLPSLDERTLAPLRQAFDDAGLVAHESRGAPPSSAAVVVAALLALEAADSLDRRAVAQLLRSGFVDASRIVPGSSVPKSGERGRAERAVRELARALETTRIAPGVDRADRLVETAVAAAKSEEAAGRGEVARALADMLVAAGTARTRSEHVHAARTLWGTLGIGARAGRGALSTFASDQTPKGVPRAERLAIARDARAWESLTQAVDAYESAAHASGAEDQQIEPAMFRLELAELLDSASATPGAGRAGAIRIARLADVVGEELDLLVVVDANEGLLPRDLAQDPIVSDALADALAKSSRGSVTPHASALVRSRELAALAAAAAEAARIVVAHVAEDGAGAPLAPAPLVGLLLRSGAAVVRPLDAVARAPIPLAADVALRTERERVREAFFLEPARPLSDLSADLRSSRLEVRRLVRELLENETGARDRALGVTGLERFARCPFMGLAHVVLGAREPERQEELPDAREEGMLVHEALAAAFVATHELWPERPRRAPAILERGMIAVDDVLAGAAGHAVLGAVVRLRVRDSARIVLTRAIEDDEWDFSFAEQAFGGRGDPWDALTLDDGAVRARLRGKIDRIDSRHAGGAARVVDYKRSKSTVREAAAGLGETALQVPLYAGLAARRLGVPATGAYLPTQPRDLATGAGGTSPKVERRMEELVAREAPDALSEVERRALAILGAVRDGRLAPLPVDESVCRTCAVSGGCRKPRFAMAPDDDEEEGAS